MRYLVTQGSERVREIFESIKRKPYVTSSYLGKTNLVLGGEETSAIAYNPRTNELTMTCEGKSKLWRGFKRLINKNGVTLEKVV